MAASRVRKPVTAAMKYFLRLTEEQHLQLRVHLFPGDGKEAVALLLCGRQKSESRHTFIVRKVVPIPHAACSVRSPDRITWPTDLVDSLVDESYGIENAIIKVHSHCEDYRRFSRTDDDSDRQLFSSVAALLDDGLPHASVIMLQSGELFGRVLNEVGEPVASFDAITSIGSDLRIWEPLRDNKVGAFAQRTGQAFGSGTIARLGRISAAVVGCSGTGSVVIEQLARLGVGRLVLIDPDVVEEKNLNRILNSTREDANEKRAKVHVLADAIRRMGVVQEVVPLQENLASSEAIRAVADCDVIFGCVDSVEGRHILNRIATFYVLPYFDIGVRLDADGKGGIAGIVGAVHYIQPGRSSLLSRGVYSLKEVEAEEMKRINPSLYELQRKQGYLRGVNEGRPAVISVNMFFAALAVNDFLARIHPYRNQPNSDFASIPCNLAEMTLLPEPEGPIARCSSGTSAEETALLFWRELRLHEKIHLTVAERGAFNILPNVFGAVRFGTP